MKFLAVILTLLLDSVCSFVIAPVAAGGPLEAGQTRSSVVASSTVLRAQSMDGENLRPDAAEALNEMAAEATGLIERLVKENKVMLFMKGNRMFPQCGFSNTAIQVLRACDVEFETYDVLSNGAVREKIKEYADWPTIPQLYLDGEFTGGSDIMIESFQSGELKKMLESAGAKFLPSG